MPTQPMAFSLDGSPYTIEATGQHVVDKAEKLRERADLLRDQGRLTETTLRAYFGDKRYEQIAESNAIEGSTLNVGETELAVEKGITITGHDPAYSTDAVNLSRALEHMVELARDPSPTDCRQVKELHSLILGGGQAAGLFRSNPVRISGSPHTPPATWHAIESAVGDTGSVSTRWYDAELSVGDYAALCEGDSAGDAWLFRVDVDIPGLDHDRYLAWTGFRSFEMKDWLQSDDGPAVFWSIPDPMGVRKWRRDDSQSPGFAELTLELPDVDRWIARLPGDQVVTLEPSEVAARVAQAVVDALVGKEPAA